MNIRLLWLGLPLLLSGCSTFSALSWSSLSPMHWFSSTPALSAEGLGSLTAVTPLKTESLEQALGNGYQYRQGMNRREGKINTFYQVLKDNQVQLVVSGTPEGTVGQIELLSSDIATVWGTQIGTPFAKIYKQAFGVCERETQQRDTSENGNAAVICVAPQSPNIHYVFQGPWSGPQSLMPSDDVLQHWKVQAILWQAH